jgi:hypothetical protein
VLLIVSSQDEAEIDRRLASDPWTLSDHLRVTSVEPWNVLVGAERISSAAPV